MDISEAVTIMIGNDRFLKEKWLEVRRREGSGLPSHKNQTPTSFLIQAFVGSCVRPQVHWRTRIPQEGAGLCRQTRKSTVPFWLQGETPHCCCHQFPCRPAASSLALYKVWHLQEMSPGQPQEKQCQQRGRAGLSRKALTAP